MCFIGQKFLIKNVYVFICSFIRNIFIRNLNPKSKKCKIKNTFKPFFSDFRPFQPANVN